MDTPTVITSIALGTGVLFNTLSLYCLNTRIRLLNRRLDVIATTLVQTRYYLYKQDPGGMLWAERETVFPNERTQTKPGHPAQNGQGD